MMLCSMLSLPALAGCAAVGPCREALQCELTPASSTSLLQDYFRSVTGLPISPYFSAFKFLWLLQNVPAVTEAVKAGAASVGGLLLSC